MIFRLKKTYFIKKLKIHPCFKVVQLSHFSTNLYVFYIIVNDMKGLSVYAEKLRHIEAVTLKLR